MMENTKKLLDEIDGLKKYRDQTVKALERIDQWHTREVSNPNTEGRKSEKETLETVLRIFKEEGVGK